MTRPPTLPQLVAGWRSLLAQFDTRSTRLLVAGEVLEHMASELHALGDVREAHRLLSIGQTLFEIGRNEAITVASELERVKKGTPPEAH